MFHLDVRLILAKVLVNCQKTSRHTTIFGTISFIEYRIRTSQHLEVGHIGIPANTACEMAREQNQRRDRQSGFLLFRPVKRTDRSRIRLSRTFDLRRAHHLQIVLEYICDF